MALKFRLPFTPSVSTDVVKRTFELVTKTGEADENPTTSTTELDLAATSIDFTVAEGLLCAATIIDTDDAGNVTRSEAKLFEAKDTFPPAPSLLGEVEALGEEQP